MNGKKPFPKKLSSSTLSLQGEPKLPDIEELGTILRTTEARTNDNIGELANECVCKGRGCENGCAAKRDVPTTMQRTREAWEEISKRTVHELRQDKHLHGKALADEIHRRITEKELTPNEIDLLKRAWEVQTSRSKMLLTGWICPAKCQTQCTEMTTGQVAARNRPGKASVPTHVEIKHMETFLFHVDRVYGFHEAEIREQTKHPKPSYPYNKVAVIGAGPAGLELAEKLASEGFDVTVFDDHERGGGLLSFGIPDQKLDKDLTEHYIRLFELKGIKFSFGKKVTKSDLQDFNQIHLAVGAQSARWPEIKVKISKAQDPKLFARAVARNLVTADKSEVTLTLKLAAEHRILQNIMQAVPFLSEHNRSIFARTHARSPYQNALFLGRRTVHVVGNGLTATDCKNIMCEQIDESIEKNKTAFLPEPLLDIIAATIAESHRYRFSSPASFPQFKAMVVQALSQSVLQNNDLLLKLFNNKIFPPALTSSGKKLCKQISQQFLSKKFLSKESHFQDHKLTAISRNILGISGFINSTIASYNPHLVLLQLVDPLRIGVGRVFGVNRGAPDSNSRNIGYQYPMDPEKRDEDTLANITSHAGEQLDLMEPADVLWDKNGRVTHFLVRHRKLKEASMDFMVKRYHEFATAEYHTTQEHLEDITEFDPKKGGITVHPMTGEKTLPGYSWVQTEAMILALGFEGVKDNRLVHDLGLKADKWGNLEDIRFNATSVPGVFVHGDANPNPHRGDPLQHKKEEVVIAAQQNAIEGADQTIYITQQFPENPLTHLSAEAWNKARSLQPPQSVAKKPADDYSSATSQAMGVTIHASSFLEFMRNYGAFSHNLSAQMQ